MTASPSNNNAIYLISPSSAVADADALHLACDRLQEMGFPTQLDQAALSKYLRFAGSDQERTQAFERALKQPARFVMATRGGYGLSRLLPFINWQAVADSGKIFVGHSDFTAFNLALLAQTGAESWAGPTAAFDFGAPEVDELTASLFAEALRGELEILGFEAEESDAVDTRGVLWGGNLAMVTSLLATPYFPNIQGGILFLEDVGEHPYRIERMLAQLWQAGVLASQNAIVLGQFTDYRLSEHDNGFTFDKVKSWLRKVVKTPVVAGLPYGHVPLKATLPVGRQVGLAVEAGMAYLVLNEH